MGTLTDAIAFPLHLHSPFRRSYFPSPSMCSTTTTPTPSFAPTTVETAKCDLSLYNKKYDVDVKLLIIVVADIDKKDDKECDKYRHGHHVKRDNKWDPKHDNKHDNKWEPKHENKHDGKWDPKHDNKHDNKWEPKHDNKHDSKWDSKHENKHENHH